MIPGTPETCVDQYNFPPWYYKGSSSTRCCCCSIQTITLTLLRGSSWQKNTWERTSCFLQVSSNMISPANGTWSVSGWHSKLPVTWTCAWSLCALASLWLNLSLTFWQSQDFCSANCSLHVTSVSTIYSLASSLLFYSIYVIYIWYRSCMYYYTKYNVKSEWYWLWWLNLNNLEVVIAVVLVMKQLNCSGRLKLLKLR